MLNRLVYAACVFCATTATALAQGSFVNFETPPVHPADMTPDGTKLLVVNTSDNRLEVFTLGGPLPVWTASVPVGLEPTSVRVRTNGEAWVVNHLSDSVSVVNLLALNVVTSIFPGDEPTDVVFAGAPLRAFVCVSRPAQMKVYNLSNLALPPTVVAVDGADPRALATDGSRVYAAIFQSGNRSMVVPAPTVSSPASPYGGINPPPNSGMGFNPPIAPGLPPPPPVSQIVNREGTNWKDDNQHIWDPLVNWGLNQHEVAIIDAGTLAVTYADNLVNNINMAIAVQPGTGRVTLTGHYLRNEDRFETFARAQFTRVNLCGFNPLLPPTPQNNNGASVIDINQHLFVTPPVGAYITNPTPAQVHLSITDPRGMVWNAAGTSVYISGMGSNNVVKTTTTAVRQATIDVGNGPTGLVLDVPRNRLYCLNRFDATVSSINTSNDTEVGRVNFFDPTPQVIKVGRPLLYDGHRTSRLGQASCAGCHIDARTDQQAWDLGDPSGTLKLFNATCNSGIPFAGTCNDWHPMKGPMVTQPLIGLNNAEPFHWRGDRSDLHGFSVGFTGLLGAASPPTFAEIDQLEDFLATIRFAPNPFRTFNDALPASVPGFPGNPSNGAALFNAPGLVSGTAKCSDCHSLPSGGKLTIVSPNVIQQSQGLKVPQLRELYRKTGLNFQSTSNTKGFGFTHDGSADTIFGYLHRPEFTFPPGPPGGLGDQQRGDLEAFLMCFPTDTHPAVGVQITVDGNNKNTPEVISLVNNMTALADTGVVSVVAKGVVGGLARGYAYTIGTGNFRSDRAVEVVSATTLRQSAVASGEITFTVVPAGTQTRIGLDRDGDGFFDRDEIDAGTDPADPLSHPPGPAVPAASEWGILALSLGLLTAGTSLVRRRSRAEQ